jgi:hypothetical protein
MGSEWYEILCVASDIRSLLLKVRNAGFHSKRIKKEEDNTGLTKTYNRQQYLELRDNNN